MQWRDSETVGMDGYSVCTVDQFTWYLSLYCAMTKELSEQTQSKV